MSAKLLTGNETFSYTISTPPPRKKSPIFGHGTHPI